MHITRRRIAATTATMLISAAALTACSAGSGNTGAASSKPTKTSAATAAASKCIGTFGDVVATDPVTDDRGTYCSVAINPSAAALTDDSAIKTDTLEAVGATIDLARTAQRNAVAFIGDNWVDSPMLEQNTRDGADGGWKDWAAAHADQFTAEVNESNKTVNPAEAQVVYNGYLPNTLARDGGPRVSNVSIDVVETVGQQVDGKPQLAVRSHVVAKYRATDEDTVTWLTAVDGKNEADLRTSNPELFDGTGDNNIVYDGVVAYGYDISSGLINGSTIKGNLGYAKAAG